MSNEAISDPKRGSFYPETRLVLPRSKKAIDAYHIFALVGLFILMAHIIPYFVRILNSLTQGSLKTKPPPVNSKRLAMRAFTRVLFLAILAGV